MTPRRTTRRGTGVVHALCRWILGAAGFVVPRELRAAWRAEWEAEVWHHLRGGGGREDAPPSLSVLRRCLGAFRHALWLRREQLILASREGMTMKGLWNDVRHAVRGLARAPMFTATTVGTLGLGVGAVVAIFTVLHGVLLDPLPFEEPDELVSVWHTAPGWGFDEVPVALTQWATYREESRTLEQIGLWAAQPVTITGIGEPERVSAVGVTWELLPLLGVEPVLGRRFSAEDDAPGEAETVLLGHGYWTRALGADPAVLGTTLRVSGRSREVIGVLPAGFGLPGEEPDILFPFQFDRENVVLGGFNYQAIARLSAGASLESAAADVARMIRLVPELHGGTPLPILEAAGFAPNLRTLERDFVGDVGRTLWVLLGTGGIVLLIACANVANLFLVRAEGRQQEVSLRAALGAARSRIARHFLVESLALAMVGGLLGITLAYVGTRLLVSSGPADLPRLSNIVLGPQALVVALVLSAVSGLVFGLLPLAHTRGAGLMASLKEGGRGGVAGGARVRARNVLVVLQVAMALVLLTASGLMIRSFQALRDVDPGFGHAEDVVTFRLAVPEAEIGPNAEVSTAYDEIGARLSEIPGATSVAATSCLPLDEMCRSSDAVFFEDAPLGPDETAPVERFKWVTGGYFETLEQPMVAGRPITRTDVRDRNPVVVVSRSFAERQWGDAASALGHRITWGTPQSSAWSEVVGVVADTHDDGVDQPAPGVLYWPLATAHPMFPSREFVPRAMSFAVRIERGSIDALAPEIRDVVRAVHANLALADMGTLDRLLARSMARTSFTMVMLLVSAGVALALGLVGIYGVVSYVVSQRTREIGVRMALGAERADVQRLVVRHGFVLGTVGVAVGLAAAAGLTRLMSALLYGVAATDPLTFASVSVLLTAVTLVASYLPARRASRTDPLVALRAE